MIGAVIFVLPSSLAVYGGIGIFGWLLTSLGALLSLLYSMWAICGVGSDALFWGLALILAGSSTIMIFGLLQMTRSGPEGLYPTGWPILRRLHPHRLHTRGL